MQGTLHVGRPGASAEDRRRDHNNDTQENIGRGSDCSYWTEEERDRKDMERRRGHLIV